MSVAGSKDPWFLGFSFAPGATAWGKCNGGNATKHPNLKPIRHIVSYFFLVAFSLRVLPCFTKRWLYPFKVLRRLFLIVFPHDFVSLWFSFLGPLVLCLLGVSDFYFFDLRCFSRGGSFMTSDAFSYWFRDSKRIVWGDTSHSLARFLLYFELCSRSNKQRLNSKVISLWPCLSGWPAKAVWKIVQRPMVKKCRWCTNTFLEGIRRPRD